MAKLPIPSWLTEKAATKYQMPVPPNALDGIFSSRAPEPMAQLLRREVNGTVMAVITETHEMFRDWPTPKDMAGKVSTEVHPGYAVSLGVSAPNTRQYFQMRGMDTLHMAVPLQINYIGRPSQKLVDRIMLVNVAGEYSRGAPKDIHERVGVVEQITNGGCKTYYVCADIAEILEWVMHMKYHSQR